MRITINCRGCGVEVSTEMPVCPQCGTRKPGRKRTTFYQAVYLLAGAGLVAWLLLALAK